MAETTRANPQQQPAGPQDARRREDERQAREEAHQRSVEALSNPEQPTPTQEEADAIKEGAMSGGLEAQPKTTQPPENETAEQRKERTEREAKERTERRERDQRPDTTRSGYQTR